MVSDQDYVLGTHDEEIARLALRHRVWRPQVLDAWRRARFSSGQTLLDIGSGPGNASLDLADIVGPTGGVVALDKSRRFLDALEASARARALQKISTHQMDLDRDPLPDVVVDGVWYRWVMSFMARPRDLIVRVGERLRPGGRFVVHEYLSPNHTLPHTV